MSDSFFTSYLQYLGETEVPAGFNRWAAIVGIGSLLEKNMWFDFGQDHIFPNQYVMLIGSAGTRKGTAIKNMQRLLVGAGVQNFSAERTSKEKFLLDLSGEETDSTGSGDNILERNLGFLDTDESSVHPMNIYVDEANDFFGIGNMEFLSILGSLWDWPNYKPYTNKIKTGKSVSITKPAVSIIAGNTPSSFQQAFPPEIIGQGFFSRILLVYGEPNGIRLEEPKIPTPDEIASITRLLQEIRLCKGLVERTTKAKLLSKAIYSHSTKSVDSRFDSYFNRRSVHLRKLTIICAAASYSNIITEDHVIEANTYLSYIESLMPKALGEYGKSRHSDVTNKILGKIESQDGTTVRELHTMAAKDLDKQTDLGDILRKLITAEKITMHNHVYFAIRKPALGTGSEKGDEFIDRSYLTEEELRVGTGSHNVIHTPPVQPTLTLIKGT